LLGESLGMVRCWDEIGFKGPNQFRQSF